MGLYDLLNFNYDFNWVCTVIKINVSISVFRTINFFSVDSVVFLHDNFLILCKLIFIESGLWCNFNDWGRKFNSPIKLFRL